MASKETTKAGRPRRRQTRASTSDGEDVSDQVLTGQTVARRATRRTTLTTLGPASPVAVTETTSLLETDFKPQREVSTCESLGTAPVP